MEDRQTCRHTDGWTETLQRDLLSNPSPARVDSPSLSFPPLGSNYPAEKQTQFGNFN